MTSVSLAHSVATPPLPQSFFFDWNALGQPYPIPVTAQCESIHIVWQRSTATGPNNVAPYYLQVYTSIYIVPIIIPVGSGLVFDWAVPFPPGTLYQICMFDKNGNTGGCQATYSVIPATITPTCANVTFPPLLSVNAQVDNGPMSQYGWIDQCSDISITPKNGTPPYTLTIAPALHPPYNITSPDMRGINWTVGLSWATPFFLSVVDSAGNMWANGLLHSGAGTTSACLADNPTRILSNDTVKPAVVVGAGFGGLGVGLFAGILIAFLFLRRHYRGRRRERYADMASSIAGSPQVTAFGLPTTEASLQYRPVPSTAFGGLMDNSMGSSNPSSLGHTMGRVGSTPYHVEPFVMPGEDGRLIHEPLSPIPFAPTHASTAHEPAYGSSSHRSQNQIYVVHHDSQAPPVTIYHEDGTQIVELPPRYPTGASSSSQSEGLSDARSVGRSASVNRSDGGRTNATEPPTFLQEQRRPTVARKPAQETGHSSNSAT